jgi:DNA (cytosine-5)-methyltransferase 1
MGYRYCVRRITPTEAERLQGMEDGFTDIPWRGKEHAPDGLRYKAIGNSIAVPVIGYIGERIKLLDEISRGTAELG